MQRSAAALFAVINDVLDSSRIEAEKMMIRLARGNALKDVIRLLASRKGVRCRSTSARMCRRMSWGTRRGIRQAALNLAGNAVNTDEGSAGIHVRRDTGGITHIAVRDTGPGIVHAGATTGRVQCAGRDWGARDYALYRLREPCSGGGRQRDQP
jgi:signal transduction histidine kinase